MTTTTRKAPAKKSAPKAAVPTIKVMGQPEKPYRAKSARAVWWDTIQAYDGKPLAEFVAAVQAAAPSTPNHGKLKGQLEPPMGWVRFFQKSNLISLADK